jgi:hypothetical protein
MVVYKPSCHKKKKNIPKRIKFSGELWVCVCGWFRNRHQTESNAPKTAEKRKDVSKPHQKKGIIFNM